MKRISIILPLLLIACSARPAPVDDPKAEALIAELEATKAELAKLLSRM